MKPINILVVEDDRLLAWDLQKTLENAGHTAVRVVKNIPDALACLDEKHPDLIFLDLFLEGNQDGLEIAREVLKRKRIPIIILTGSTDNTNFERVKNVFLPAAYLTKPFNPPDIPRLVELTWKNFRKDDITPEPFVLEDTVFLPVEKRYEKFIKSEVICIQTQKGTHSVHVSEAYRKAPRPVNLSIGHVEPYFDLPYFFKLSRSVIVNLNFIDHIESAGVKLQGIDNLLPVPDSTRAELMRRLGRK